MIPNLSFVHWLVVLSALLSAVGTGAYIAGIKRGTTKPNLVTWSMWALAPLVATGAALSAHADPWTTTRTFLAGFWPVIILLAVFIKRNGFWKLTAFDFLCGILSLLALVFWLVAGLPKIAVLFAAVGDAFASLPTIIKAWKHPETETGLLFIASFLSVLLVIPSIPDWNIENVAFPAYLLVCNVALIVAFYRKKIFQKAG